MFKRLAAALLLRTISRDLARIAAALDRQSGSLERLSQHFAPRPTAGSDADRATIKADTGLSYADPDDIALAEYYIARTQASTGHIPDDEEIAIYLGDERTTDLRKRLAERDLELTRLAESRR